jgi:hypothetical protein
LKYINRTFFLALIFEIGILFSLFGNDAIGYEIISQRSENTTHSATIKTDKSTHTQDIFIEIECVEDIEEDEKDEKSKDSSDSNDVILAISSVIFGPTYYAITPKCLTTSRGFYYPHISLTTLYSQWKFDI